MNRQYTKIYAVIQANPMKDEWIAGYGYEGLDDGKHLFSGAAALESYHARKAEAKTAAIEHAFAFRNKVLTLGGCTFETLPKVYFSNWSK